MRRCPAPRCFAAASPFFRRSPHRAPLLLASVVAAGRQPLPTVFSSAALRVAPARFYTDAAPTRKIKVTFLGADGAAQEVEGNEGQNLLSLAHENNVDLEGACEGALACSTCHVVLDAADYKKLEEPTDEENDMLDLAFGLTETSRLGCQVRLTPQLDGMKITIPSATRNIAVDGYKPPKH